MKLFEIAVAARPLQKLIGQDLPLRNAYQLAMLVSQLNPSLEFYGEQLMLGRRKDELDDIDADAGPISKVVLPLNLDISLSAGDVKCLEPFVEFVEVDAVD